MTKSEFKQVIGSQVAAKELRSFTTKIFIMNAFLVELRERSQEIYLIPEKDIDHKKEATKRLINFIDSQIDGLAYNSMDVNNMSFTNTTISELLENL